VRALYVSHSVVSGTYPSVGLIKCAYHGWLSMMMSSEAPPLFSLALAPQA